MAGAELLAFGDDRGTRYLHVLRVALLNPPQGHFRQALVGAYPNLAGNHGEVSPPRYGVIVPRFDRI